MAGEVLFEIRQISFSYGQNMVLRNLSLDLVSGKFYAIVGPNGCGKTTLLDLMAGILTPDSGTIKCDGRPLPAYPKRELAKKIALVPQDFYINFPFTVREVVLMGRHPYIPRFGSPDVEDLEIVANVMRLMDIDQLGDKFVTELSGGEKQRVVFARAFAQDTPVLIVDEGTSNMDIRHTLKSLSLARDAAREQGKTMIAAMHDLNLAAAFCDCMVFMESGRIVAQGHLEEVFNEDNIRAVFDVEARVYFDQFCGSKQVVYKL